MKPTHPSGLQPAIGLKPRQTASDYPAALMLAGDPDAGTVIVRLDCDPLPWSDADLGTLADAFTKRVSFLILGRDRGLVERVGASLQFLAQPAGGHA